MLSGTEITQQRKQLTRTLALQGVHSAQETMTCVCTSDAQRLFFSECVLAYTKRYNTCSIRFAPLAIWVLS